MTIGEQLYLALVVLAFLGFGATLAVVTFRRTANPKAGFRGESTADGLARRP